MLFAFRYVCVCFFFLSQKSDLNLLFPLKKPLNIIPYFILLFFINGWAFSSSFCNFCLLYSFLIPTFQRYFCIEHWKQQHKQRHQALKNYSISTRNRTWSIKLFGMKEHDKIHKNYVLMSLFYGTQFFMCLYVSKDKKEILIPEIATER